MRDYVAEGFEPDTPEEMAQEWAATTGMLDGYAGGVSPEGRLCLKSDGYIKKSYLFSYQDSFIARKFEEGAITHEDWLFYDVYCWPTYDGGYRK